MTAFMMTSLPVKFISNFHPTPFEAVRSKAVVLTLLVLRFVVPILCEVSGGGGGGGVSAD